MSKICLRCNEEFETKRNNSCCSVECSNVIKKQKAQLWRDNNKELKKELNKVWYFNNRDENIERNKRWKKDNKERVSAYRKRYAEDNKERLKELSKVYILKNRSRITKRMEKWRRINEEHVKKYNRIYKETHKDSIKIRRAMYQSDNKDKKALWDRRYYVKNSEDIKQRVKDWKSNNLLHSRQQHNEHNKKRRSLDLDFKFICNLRRHMARVFKGESKKLHSLEYCDYNPEEFKDYIEKQFQEGMSWDNWTIDGWHLDHIKPISKFNFFNNDGSENLEQIRECFSLINLQPLWARDNLSKGNRY